MSTLLVSVLLQTLFRMEVNVLDAIEGGPLVLKVTTTYLGVSPIKIYYVLDDAQPHEVCDASTLKVMYSCERQPFFYFGPLSHFEALSEHRTIYPGDKKVVIIPIHNQYVGNLLVAGKAELLVSFRLLFFSSKTSVPLQLGIQKRVAIEIRLFTDAFSKAVYADIARLGGIPGNTPTSHHDEYAKAIHDEYENAIGRQTDRIVGTLHPELVPHAFELLMKTTDRYTIFRLRKFLWATLPGERYLYRRDVSMLLSSFPGEWWMVRECFDDWYVRERSTLSKLERVADAFIKIVPDPMLPNNKMNLPHDCGLPPSVVDWCYAWQIATQRMPEKQLQRLKVVKPIWLRAFVYVTFGDRLSNNWKDQFLLDLADHVNVSSEERIQGWIGKLDDPEFQVREEAHERLRRHITQVKPLLRKARQDGLSPEAVRRVDELLHKSGPGRRDVYEIAFFDWLDSGRDLPLGRRVLEVLAKGDPSFPATDDAKCLLNPPSEAARLKRKLRLPRVQSGSPQPFPFTPNSFLKEPESPPPPKER